jgi:hypothetical protein
MAQIQSGLDTTLATVDPVHNALLVRQKGTSEVSFTHLDATLDSFERLRTSEARIIFEYAFGGMTPTTASTIWEAGTVGAGSTEALTPSLYGTNLTLPVTTGVGRWIQAYSHVRYAPGISTLFRATFNFNNIGAGIRARIGMFTDQGTFPSASGDGLYLENDAGSIAVVRRYMTQGSGSEERVSQASWNLNKMDGAGDVGDPSSNIITLNWANTQQFVMEYQWLGVGTIRFGFETGQKGIVWCHEMHSVNVLAEAWSRTGSFPVRAECYNYATAAISNFTLINCCVIQEGDVAENRGWRYFGGSSGAVAKVGGLVSNALYPVMGIRAVGSNDITKRAKIIPTILTVTVAVPATGPTALFVQLLMLGSPNTAATYAIATGGSVVVVDIAATASTIITGSSTFSACIPNTVGTHVFDLGTMSDSMNTIGTAASGVQAITGPGNYTLAVGPVQTATVGASIVATMNWKELV